MKAAFLTEINKPLIVKDTDIPKPGPYEVIIEQEYTGICYRDILTYEGYFPRVKLPIIPGHEIAGKIIELGENVQGFKVGDRVASLIYIPCGQCKNCKLGLENLCRNKLTYGEDVNGGYAKYVKVHVNSLVKIPRKASIENAVIAACLTGMLIHALKYRAKIRKDDWILVTGAGGGVGIHAIQIAKALETKVIAVTSSEWKVNKIKEVGADHIIVAKDGFVEEVKKITDNEGVDVVIESVGQPTFEQSFRSVKWGGKVIAIGNVKVQPVQVNLGLLILREVAILGSLSSRKREVREALRLASKGKIKPIIDSIINLEEVNEAYTKLKNKGAIGRIFIKLT
jgi:Zn-dependent alcohol dehydrogenases